jgi:filamentous hemagglutinin family protein
MFKKLSLIISLLSLLTLGNRGLVQAQEIKIDGNTATVITKDGNHITIDGSTLSKDGKNLFHSLQEFGLSQEQIATFLTNPNIRNILTRVTGGNPSYINGLIQVVGGNSNLFLINPAGVVFGKNATLNIPADFTATTATSIGFGDQIFQAIGTNDYQNLVGNPTSFIFNSNQPGSIVNSGNLELNQGANLSLIAGNVINTGTIKTPNGNINIQAVGNGNTVKITTEGSVLSLIIEVPTDAQGNPLGFTVQDLPTLLTGSKNAGVETPGATVNPVTGNAEVAGVPIPNESGITAISGKLETSSDTLNGGDITVLGNKVAVLGGTIEANGATGGGTILIGGDIQGQGTIPNSQITSITKGSEISANATVEGDGGEIIIFAEDSTLVDGKLSATSVNGNGGLIETSGLKSFVINTTPDVSSTNGTGGTWLIDPYNIEIFNGDGTINIDYENPFVAIGDDARLGVGLIQEALQNGSVTVSTGTSGTQEGNITWNADADLNYNGIGTGNTLTLNAANKITYNGFIADSDFTNDSLNVKFESSSIDYSGVIIGGDGTITLNATSGNIALNPSTTPEILLVLSGSKVDLTAVGEVTATTPIEGSGNLNITGSNLNLGQIGSSLDPFGDLKLTSSGTTNLNGTITAGSLTTDAPGTTNINTNSITTTGDQEYKDTVTINNPIELKTTSNGKIEFAQTVNSQSGKNNSLTLNTGTGDITFTGAVGNTQALGAIKANSTSTTQFNSTVKAASITTNADGTTQLGGDVTTTGDQEYKDAVTINNPIELKTTNNGKIEFAQTVNSQTQENNSLTLNTGTGDITFTGAVGNTQALGAIKANSTSTTQFNSTVKSASLTTNEGGTTQLGGNVTTTGAQEYKDAVTLQQNTTLNGQNITFSSTVDGSFELNLNATDSGKITFNGVVGGRNLLSKLTTTNEKATTEINTTSIKTSGDQTYNNPVTLQQNTTLEGNKITFGSTVDGGFELNLNPTDSGKITFNGVVGGSTRLSKLTTTNEKATTEINTTSIKTSGDQTYNNPVTLKQNTTLNGQNITTTKGIIVDPSSTSPISLTITATKDVTLSAPSNSLPVAISTAIPGGNSGDVNVSAGGNIKIQGIVETSSLINTQNPSLSAGSVTINGNTTNPTDSSYVFVGGVSTAGINKSGSVTINGTNIVTGPIVSSFPNSGAGGTINLNGLNNLVLGQIQGESLTVGGNLILSNPSVHSQLVSSLFNITTPEDLNNEFIATSKITTTGSQTYNGNIFIEDAVTFTGNNLTFKGGIDSFKANINQSTTIIGEAITGFATGILNRSGATPQSVTITSTGNGTINLNDPLGSVAGLASLTVNNGQTNINISGDGESIRTTGDQTYNSAVNLQQNTTLTANHITFGSTVDGGVNLNLNSNNSGITTFNGVVGGNTALNQLTTNADGSNRFNTTSVTTTGNQTYNDNLTLAQNIRFTTPATFTSSNISGENTSINVNASQINTGSVTTNGGNIDFVSTNGGIKTGNLNTSGSNGGDITLKANQINTDSVTTDSGSIDFTSTGGNITTGDLDTSSTRGGDIELNSSARINTGNIDSSGSQQAGDITIKAQGEIQVSSIDASSSNGSGGTVNIETPTVFRAVSTIPDQAGVSISSTGPGGGDSITIKYDGDRNNRQPPFTVGSATQNGTVGAIQSSQVTITQGVFPFTTRRDNIAIISIKGPSGIDGGGCVPNCPVDTTKNEPPQNPLYPPKIQVRTIDEAKEVILEIERATAEKPALIYVGFYPVGYNPQDLNEDFQRREGTSAQEYIDQLGLDKANLPLNVSPPPRPDDQLDILVITSQDKPVRVTVPITREQVVNTANDLWVNISDPLDLSDSYKPQATQLYSWLITPIKEVLEQREITNLLFMMPSQLRLIPISALYDSANQQYLVEKYSSGYAPSLNLNDNTYRDLTQMNLLAMGASNFADPSVVPLPSVGLEIPTIKKVWEAQVVQSNYQQYINQNFTLDNIKNNLQQNSYGIIHLGTHGEFKPGEVLDSYIQLYNDRLGLNDIRGLELRQGDLPVELLVLSACETAFGDENVELGFVGLAVQSGVKSALGSLWQVSDTGTLALMTDFYSQLRQGTIKAEALRQAQLNMIQGKVYKTPQGNEIVTPNLNLSLTDLPPRSQQPEDFSHPFYWSPFTLIGSPW